MIGQAVRLQGLVESERQRLVDENTHLRQELKAKYDFPNLVGTSGPMRQVFDQVAQVARTNTTVLIRGESGTGKELIAHAIHYNSLRAGKPFVKVSCGALPDTLIESELFGYEKGAFTGAHQRRKGRFELAEGGTLFLDEIGDINLQTQVKLLRVLQEREFERLGGTETIKVERPPDRRDQQVARDGDDRRARSARISTTASTSSRSSCRRCASGSRTSCCSPITSCRSSPASTASRSGASRRRPSTCS